MMRSSHHTYGIRHLRAVIHMPINIPMAAPWLAMPPLRISVMMAHGLAM